MDLAPPEDPHPGKSSMSWHREHSGDSVDMRPVDSSASPAQDDKRLIRRVRSPSRPRAWLSTSYKPKFGGRFYRPRDDHSFHKPGFSSPKHHHIDPRSQSHRRDHFQPKFHPTAPRERERDKEKERCEQGECADRSPPPKQSSTRAFLKRSTSSRDKDMQFRVCHDDRNQSRERDHRRTRSKERERSRDGELPSTASQTVARDRAIQQKRKEIDEVYYQECDMFGLVAKMLIAKDQSLERAIQSALQENLKDIGKRCVEAMQKFIEDYDSRESSH